MEKNEKLIEAMTEECMNRLAEVRKLIDKRKFNTARWELHTVTTLLESMKKLDGGSTYDDEKDD